MPVSIRNTPPARRITVRSTALLVVILLLAFGLLPVSSKADLTSADGRDTCGLAIPIEETGRCFFN